MRRPLVPVCVLGLTIVAGSCGSDNGPGDEIAQLRVIHAMAEAPPVDLVVDGRTVAEAVSYTQVSAFADVPAGPAAIELRLGGGAGTHALRGGELEPGQRYTLLFGAAARSDGLALIADTASGVPTTPPPTSASDTGAIPGENKIKVRVIHNAPTAPPLDLYVTAADAVLTGASPVIEPFSYGTGLNPEFPGYLELDPGVYRVRFTADGTADVLFDTGPVSMAAGQVRSFILFSSDTAGIGIAVVRER